MTVHICFSDQSQGVQAVLDKIEMIVFFFPAFQSIAIFYPHNTEITTRIHLSPHNIVIYLFRHRLLATMHNSHGTLFLSYIFGCTAFIMKDSSERTGNNRTGERRMASRNDQESGLKLRSPEALLRHMSESYYFYLCQCANAPCYFEGPTIK